MKTKIILSILLLSAVQAFSQITLTGSNNPIAGNTQTFTFCDTTGILQGGSGANQIWNYPSLSTRGSNLVTWVSSASTPYASQFPTSNVASTVDNATFDYFTTSSSGIIVNGAGGPSVILSYSDPETFIQYPFNYNNTFNDIFSATYMVNGHQVYRSGTINVLADAWGTITLPFGTFINALRIKNVVSIKDSSYVTSPSVVVQNSTSYHWFVPNKKFPVFEIKYSSTIINNVPTSASKSVNYNSNSTTIGISTISTEVPAEFKLYQNYPNPFNPTTKIKFDVSESKQVKLALYDILGKEVAILVNGTLKAGTYEYDLNASSLSSGEYFYKLTAGELIQTRKLTLIK
jgi:hypothetical protein